MRKLSIGSGIEVQYVCALQIEYWTQYLFLRELNTKHINQ